MNNTNARLPLSVALIAYNEAHRIGSTLRAVESIASEIIVVDSHSTDATRSIAEEYGAQVYEEDWKGYGKQKQSLLEKCTQEWILFLDCDEVVSPALCSSIRTALSAPLRHPAYRINMRTFYAGKFLNHVWQPDWHIRLVHRSAQPHWTSDVVHEKLVFSGDVGSLTGDIWHYSYPNIAEHFRKTIHYARLGAELNYARGKKVQWYNFVLNPLAGFVRRYILERGFLDGTRGLIIAMSAILYFFLKYAFLWEMNYATQAQENNTEPANKNNPPNSAS